LEYFLTEEQKAIKSLVRRIAEERIIPIRAELDEKEEFPWEIMKYLADTDMFRVFIPEEYDGLGGGCPECPESIRELYTYNPEKAKTLLTEAGYPTGFKTTMVLTAAWADYFSIIKDMWSKVGIEFDMELLEGFGALIGVAASVAYDGLLVIGCSPCSTYPEQYQYTGGSWINASRIDDPYINDMAEQARVAALTDLTAAMAITKELMKYILDQAYAIPSPRYPLYCLWWPWLKNYTGETSVGYFTGDSWVQWIWIDQELKKSMGY